VAKHRPEQIADGVWRLAGDLKAGMNVYFLADEGGVTMYDAGTKPMVKDVQEAAAGLGGLKRIVLGHSHTDHRGTAPSLGVPVHCHPDEVAYAETDDWPDYWDMSKLDVAWIRWLYPTLHRRWDDGGVEIAGTLSEGDPVAGFEVVHLPGHAPGQIGLWRDSDKLAVVSDTVYFGDGERFKPNPEIDRPGLKGREAAVPHPAFNQDTARARESLRKLAGLQPKAVWAGHETGLVGDPDAVAEEIERGAEKVFPERAEDDTAPAGAARA